MRMRNVVALVLIVAVLGMTSSCCIFGGSCSTTNATKVCMKCGEIGGSDKCCAEGAEKCAKCGLNKGSVGCCRGLKPAAGATDVILCAKCGQVKGSDVCCKPGAAKCAKCGLVKGSPGCCKIGK
ncbi:MAG: hypothetical protein ABIF82_08080 [Planctomycetota bacterium]